MYFNIHKEKCCHKSGFFSNISPRVNQRSKFRRQTYHIRDINVELNVSFHWFHIFALILNSWDDVKPMSLFISVCVVVLQMSTVILCEKVPQQCTAWIWCIMCPIHCELMGKKKESAYKFWLILWFLITFEFFWCWRALVVPCYPGSYWSSACISSTKPLCKLQTWRTLHFRRWGLSLCKYGILMCKPMNCLVRRVYLYEAVKGPRLGFKGDVHNVYMISTLFWDLQLRSGCIYIASQMDVRGDIWTYRLSLPPAVLNWHLL